MWIIEKFFLQKFYKKRNYISTSFARLKCSFLFGGGEEIRTLAPAKPTYRISNPDPSTTWVHLHLLKIGRPIYNLLYSLFGKTVSILLAFCVFCTFSKSCDPLRYKGLRVFPVFLWVTISSQPRYDHFDTAACSIVRTWVLSAGNAIKNTRQEKRNQDFCPSFFLPGTGVRREWAKIVCSYKILEILVKQTVRRNFVRKK